MPTLDLRRLAQDGTVEVKGVLAPDADLWEESGLAFAEPVKVDLVARESGAGEVIARGTVSTVLARACRRCLKESTERLDVDVAIVWSDDIELRGDDGAIRELPAGQDTIDVGEAVREELILAVPAYYECEPDCRGLCPQCGMNLNEQSCDCSTEERDPRWDALRKLQSE
jgi:uncharacterized protein